ncbi:hypothetical protein MVEN_01405900 [Mycena venus]|uniref:F-box domain-containing protein n=1 Tax=Mycena venus TaxID=2733690 RepID=A0A8H6XVC4_9AGAR|nr:hypothetical protein MVEN_01405900 [Mycena venus]
MDSKTTFPNELWLAIFSHLPPDALRNLSSTRRALYDIARPLGFTELKLQPYPYDMQPPKAQLDDALEHLRFYSSPKIAPHRLYMDRTQFTQLGITNLCGLPALTHVELSACQVAPGEQLNVDALTLGIVTFITRFGNMCNLWMSLLSRNSLRELNLYNILPLAKPDVQPFPNVHTLTVNDLPMRIWDTLTIFAKFPALRVFSTDYRGALRNLTPAQESSIFPVLQKYTGAYENLHIFIQRETLTHVTLDQSYPFRNLLAELQGVAALPNITSLKASFTTSSADVFERTEVDALLALFPGLTELELSLLPDAQEDGTFSPQVWTSSSRMIPTPSSPSTLQSLSLTWDFPFQYGSTDSAAGNDPAPPASADVPDFTSLRKELTAKCPGLKYIFLDGYHFLGLWWKLREWEGEEGAWEASAGSYDDAEVIRAKVGRRCLN